MKYLLFALTVAVAPAFATNEPQFLSPERDAALLRQFPNLYTTGAPIGEVFTMMIIGQDNASGGMKTADGRNMLSSRSDIMMFLSMNMRTHEAAILSLYRDHPPTEACVQRMGRYAPDGKINGVYSIYGRKGFIPCIEGMMEEMINAAGPKMRQAYLDRGRFRVNAFFEMTRSLTLQPMAYDLLKIVNNNKMLFLSRYGIAPLGAALKVVVNQKDISTALNGEAPIPAKIDTKDLFIELKERHIYRAHGYQRAFNNAWGIANVLGWAAYGINGSKADNYDFMGKLFGDTINRFFSRSVEFKSFERDVLMANGDHALRYLCYSQGHSPLKIILWDDNSRAYAVYQGGRFWRNTEATDLHHLKLVSFLPTPPSCD